MESKPEDIHKREEGKRLKEGTGEKIKEDENQKIGVDIKFEKNPKFIEERLKVFQELYDAQQKKYEGKHIILGFSNFMMQNYQRKKSKSFYQMEPKSKA